ncbi:hypothetical protein WN943_004157 [Citrus x changshan-huyou]
MPTTCKVVENEIRMTGTNDPKQILVKNRLNPCRLLPGALERDSLGGRTAASLIEGRSTSTGSIKVALTDTIYEKVRSSFFPATIRFALKPYLKEGEREEQLYIGNYRRLDKHGGYETAVHGVRTMVRLDDLKVDRRVLSGGSLVLQINLTDPRDGGNLLGTEFTFDGQVYWNLYSN